MKETNTGAGDLLPTLPQTGDMAETRRWNGYPDGLAPQAAGDVCDSPSPLVERRLMHGQADRVSYSFSRKLNVGNYENVEVHESYSTDLLPGETCEKALARAAAFVERTVAARVAALRKELGLE